MVSVILKMETTLFMPLKSISNKFRQLVAHLRSSYDKISVCKLLCCSVINSTYCKLYVVGIIFKLFTDIYNKKNSKLNTKELPMAKGHHGFIIKIRSIFFIVTIFLWNI